ncbi:hypothetical protein GYMLUDRAFT_237872, partial [Collybiopsis luxurians FD-317 M1]
MVTLPPICSISLLPPDDVQRFQFNSVFPCRYRPLLHDPSGMHYLDNLRDFNFLQLPRIRGPDRAQTLPSLRELDIDQLDKFRRPSHGASDRQGLDEARRDLRSSSGGKDGDRHGVRERGEDIGRWVQSTSSSHIPRSPSRSGEFRTSRSSTPTRSSYSQDPQDANADLAYSADSSSSSAGYHDHRGSSPRTQSHRDHEQPPPPPPQDSQNQQVVQRSRLQTFIIEAGGLGVALSEESMRRLRYVLQWLQYATEHIDQQILAIRDFTESLQQNYFDPAATEVNSSTPTTSGTSSGQHSRSSSASFRASHSRASSESQLQAISSAHMHKLTTLRRDVVHTVREVVNVVSKYGGGAALPEPARDAMKGFILKLPKKVGEAMRMGAPPSDTPADL